MGDSSKHSADGNKISFFYQSYVFILSIYFNLRFRPFCLEDNAILIKINIWYI